MKKKVLLTMLLFISLIVNVEILYSKIHWAIWFTSLGLYIGIITSKETKHKGVVVFVPLIILMVVGFVYRKIPIHSLNIDNATELKIKPYYYPIGGGYEIIITNQEDLKKLAEFGRLGTYGSGFDSLELKGRAGWTIHVAWKRGDLKKNGFEAARYKHFYVPRFATGIEVYNGNYFIPYNDGFREWFTELVKKNTPKSNH